MKKLANTKAIIANSLITKMIINAKSIHEVELVLTIKNNFKKTIFIMKSKLPQSNFSADIFYIRFGDANENRLEDAGTKAINPDEFTEQDLVHFNVDEKRIFVCNLATNFEFKQNIRYSLCYFVSVPLLNADRSYFYFYSEQHQREIPVNLLMSSDYINFEIE